jgi:RNA polymerase primary sigma factor
MVGQSGEMDMSTSAGSAERLRPTPPDEELQGGESVSALELFLSEVGRFPLLSPAEEIELAKRIERGDKGAKDRMISSNLRLVVSIARKYRGQQLALLDVIQEGILGLIRATEKFDWRLGHKFSTYAVWWIRESIERGIANRARIIRMPVYMVERERKIRHLERTLTAEIGREPADDEIALAANLPLAQVREVREAARPVVSLDVPVDENEEVSLGDLLVSDQSQPAEEAEVNLRRESLHSALRNLPERERQVVKLRYGIGGEPNSIEQVTRRLGLSRSLVRRLESQALARLARSRELHGAL